MRMMLSGALTLAGCASSASTPLSSHPEAHVGMRFTNAELAAAHSKSSKQIDLPFQLKTSGVNGTALLLGFLQKFEADASYISDVSYSLQMIYKGMPVECVSQIVVDDGAPKPPRAAPPPEPTDDADYSTTVAAWRPAMTDGEVVDREMHCTPHAESNLHVVERHPVNYAADVKRNLNPEAWSAQGQDPSRVEDEYEETAEVTYTNQCGFAPNKHRVHRYDHFLAAKFTPPDLELIRTLYSDFRLVESPPECHRIEHLAEMPFRQRIMANVYYTGTIRQVDAPTPRIMSHPTVLGRPGNKH